MLAVVIGIITVGPAMADKDSSGGHNKINICHFDKEDKKLVEISIPEKKAKGHAKNHVNDIIPAPEGGCPEQEDPEIETEPENGFDMDMLLSLFTEITIFEQEVDNLQSQIDGMNGGENEHYIFRHLTDKDGENDEWNPNGTIRNFLITDDGINENSIVSVSIIKPLGNEDLIPNCLEQIVEMSDDSYSLGVDCSSRLPEGTQLNYVIMNPLL